MGAGSAHEDQTLTSPWSTQSIGSTQMLELLAFRATGTKTQQDIMTEMENLGGMVQCISNRETILYCVDVLRENLEPAMDILADTVLRPCLNEKEIEEAKQIIQLQQSEIPPEFLSRDAVQRAAYIGSPLSHHHYPPSDRVGQISRESVARFREKSLYGQNCVLSAAG